MEMEARGHVTDKIWDEAAAAQVRHGHGLVMSHQAGVAHDVREHDGFLSPNLQLVAIKVSRLDLHLHGGTLHHDFFHQKNCKYDFQAHPKDYE